MNSKLILAGVAAGMTLVLCACGHSGSSGDDGSVSQSTFHQEYEISENGCDTGKHSFFGDNETDVFRQYCYELRDGTKNNFCAEKSRFDLFNASKCDDNYAWND